MRREAPATTRSTTPDVPSIPVQGAEALGVWWRIVVLVRRYVRHCPVQRGKGVLVRRVLLPALPGGTATFTSRLPGGGLVNLRPRETIGLATLLYGSFESAEISCAIRLAEPGTMAFDVGANVGVYSVALGLAVGQDGLVIAIEPDGNAVHRLIDNLALNSITSVQVVEAAAGEGDSQVELHLADDSAYNSVVTVGGGHSEAGVLVVRSVRLDDIWEVHGRPIVSVVKIDVEGAELSVVRGARAMITTVRPAILVEANDRQHLAPLQSELELLGYRRATRPGFEPWNHLFLHGDH